MHKFKLGERLFPARLDVPDGTYVVIKRLPMRDGEFEYQIKSLGRRARGSREGIETKSIGKET
jgi:hypothetical protein